MCAPDTLGEHPDHGALCLVNQSRIRQILAVPSALAALKLDPELCPRCRVEKFIPNRGGRGFRCHGCGATGSAVSAIRHHLNCSPSQARLVASACIVALAVKRHHANKAKTTEEHLGDLVGAADSALRGCPDASGAALALIGSFVDDVSASTAAASVDDLAHAIGAMTSCLKVLCNELASRGVA